jgi:hypothetical protein
MRPPLQDHIRRLDPGELTFAVREVLTGREVLARFSELTPADGSALVSDGWSEREFSYAWRSWSNIPGGALKAELLLSKNEGILGSLLATAPRHQYGSDLRLFAGIGRVLVARLVVGALKLGGTGALRVQVRPERRQFYSVLGFRSVLNSPRMLLSRDGAIKLLESAVVV